MTDMTTTSLCRRNAGLPFAQSVHLICCGFAVDFLCNLYNNNNNNNIYYYYYYIRLTAFFQDNLGKPSLGKPAPER